MPPRRKRKLCEITVDEGTSSQDWCVVKFVDDGIIRGPVLPSELQMEPWSRELLDQPAVGKKCMAQYGGALYPAEIVFMSNDKPECLKYIVETTTSSSASKTPGEVEKQGGSGMEKSLVNGLTGWFENQEHCDVVFIVEEKQIGAHKMVLAAQCQFLYAMSKDWNHTEKPISVDAVEYRTFVALLRFLYCEEMAISTDNVLTFLYASVKFEVENLEKMCVNHLSNSMSEKNVSFYMNEALQFGSKLLQDACLDIFAKHSHKVLNSEAFRRSSQPVLSAFLDAEEIQVLEILLFHFVKEWMELRCKERGLEITGVNMREVLGDAVFKIRFPTMTVQDFSNSVTTINGFLSDTEMRLIYQMITLFDQNIDCPFSNRFRCQTSQCNTPLREMIKLLKEKVLYRRIEEEAFNVRSLVKHVEILDDGKDMFRGSLRLLVQCIADLANTGTVPSSTDQNNADSRRKLSKKLLEWERACTSGNNNVSEIMTLFVEFRKELNNLTRWSFQT